MTFSILLHKMSLWLTFNSGERSDGFQTPLDCWLLGRWNKQLVYLTSRLTPRLISCNRKKIRKWIEYRIGSVISVFTGIFRMSCTYGNQRASCFLYFLDFIQANSNDNNLTILIFTSSQSWEFLTVGVIFVATEIIIFKIMISRHRFK